MYQTYSFKYAVVIGRFQPIHRGHIHLIGQALKLAQHVIVVIGSARGARTIKNPFTYAERAAMVQMPFGSEGRIHTVGVGDYLYNDSLWVAELQETVSRKINELGGEDKTILVGHNKDRTTYYLSLFPNWRYFEITQDLEFVGLNATTVRNNLLLCIPPKEGGGSALAKYLFNITDGDVAAWLMEFTEHAAYARLVEEFDAYYQAVSKYGGGPFITADSVVLSNGHVLLIRRKNCPGKGLLALPGGFVEAHEFIQAAALRELEEETSLRLSPESILDSKVFDHPDRSLRGRTITHAHLFQVPDTKLAIKAGDDADRVMWEPIHSVFSKESEFFEDHYSILRYFLLRH